MTDIFFPWLAIAALAAGAISVFWIKRSIDSVTDDTIQRLFTHILALIVSMVAIILVLIVTLPHLSCDSLSGDSFNKYTRYILIVSILALISGTAIAVKHIADVYGFKVGDDKPALKKAKKGKVK